MNNFSDADYNERLTMEIRQKWTWLSEINASFFQSEKLNVYLFFTTCSIYGMNLSPTSKRLAWLCIEGAVLNP